MSQTKVVVLFPFSPSLSSKDKCELKRSAPDLYSVPADPPRWGLLWIAPLLVLESQSQWGNAEALSTKGKKRGPFSSTRAGDAAPTVKNRSAHDLNTNFKASSEIWIQPHTCSPLDKFQKSWTSYGLCFCFHYRGGRFANLIAREQLRVITNSRQQYLPWQDPNVNLRSHFI